MSLFENSVVRGALAGIIATVPMTMVMTKLHEFLPRDQRRQPLPPGQIVANAENRMGYNPDRGTHEALTAFSHFAYGAVCGALYGLLSSQSQAKPMLKGSSFGLAVWGVSYMGWLPAVQLLPSALRQPKERNSVMIFSHLVWGVTLSRLATRSSRELVKTAFSSVTESVGSRSLTTKWIQQAMT